MQICPKLPGWLREVKPRQAVFPIILLIQFLFLAGVLADEKKEFPEWDQGVYAEINRRHGEKSAARMIDVLKFTSMILLLPNWRRQMIT